MRALRSVLGALAIAMAASNVRAGELTDFWWVPSEPGWNVQVMHQGSTLLVSLLVYGPDRMPVWYFGPNVELAGPNSALYFSGPLYQTKGTWFGNPGMASTSTPVGHVYFTALGGNVATLRYIIGGVTVDKTVERYVFRKEVDFQGLYDGIFSVTVSATPGNPPGICPGAGTFQNRPTPLEITGDATNLVVKLQTTLGNCAMRGFYKEPSFSAGYTCETPQGTTTGTAPGTITSTPTTVRIQFTSAVGGGCMEQGSVYGVRR